MNDSSIQTRIKHSESDPNVIEPIIKDSSTGKQKVMIGVVNYNRKDALEKTLKAISGLQYTEFEVMVVDNHSNDGSAEWGRKAYPGFKFICLGENNGPNVARNVILHEAQTDYVLIMDNDIILEPDALSNLVEVIRKESGIALCHAEIKDPKYPNFNLHYNGGWIHYLGAFTPRIYSDEPRLEFEIFDSLSGQALLVDRLAARKVGFFDTYYFFGWDDGDFTVRLSLAGYQCVNVPKAIGYHNSKTRQKPQVFYQVRNRWYFILKMYSWKTLLLATPILAIYEASLLIFLHLKGYGKDYWRGNFAIIRDLPIVMQARKSVSPYKKKKDKDWLKAGDLFVPETVSNKRFLRLLIKSYNHLFNLYWRLIKPFCV